jgi:hypothetical protein
MKGFDPDHPRCIFPKYGAIVDAAMRGKNLSTTDVVKHLKIDPSGPAGWRRGFGRNGPTRTAQLEALLGVKLDMGEVLPSAKGCWNAARDICYWVQYRNWRVICASTGCP